MLRLSGAVAEGSTPGADQLEVVHGDRGIVHGWCLTPGVVGLKEVVIDVRKVL